MIGAVGFYEFMKERELIRLRRAAGLPRPWTQNEVLQKYSFTNVKREHDRMSRFFKSLYDRHRYTNEDELAELLVTCAVYRYFGTEKSAEVLGAFSLLDTWDEYKERLLSYGQQNDLTFTGAYIVPNAGRTDEKYIVVADILTAIHGVRNEIVLAMYRDKSWEKAAGILKNCYGCGSFMAKEVLLDFIMATGHKPDDWQTWTPVGPGARRGAARVLSGGPLTHPGGLPEPKALETIQTLWAMRDEYWPRRMDYELSPSHVENCESVSKASVCGCRKENLPNSVQLDLTDIQFQLCEYDKYLRAVLNEGKKPKKLFKPYEDRKRK